MASETDSISKNRYSETTDETRRLLREYYRVLVKLGVDTIERGTRLQHAKWMCTFAEGSIKDEAKANRWLGFIQGWLIVENIFSLDECMEHSRNGKIG